MAYSVAKDCDGTLCIYTSKRASRMIRNSDRCAARFRVYSHILCKRVSLLAAF